MAESKLNIKNLTKSTIVYKLKTTATKSFCVRPSAGILYAEEEACIRGIIAEDMQLHAVRFSHSHLHTVLLQPINSELAANAAKFMIVTSLVPPDFSPDQLNDVVRSCNSVWTFRLLTPL